MTWNPTPKEVAFVLASDANSRYVYFVKHIADEEALWSLRGTLGWNLAEDAEGRRCVPIWPHAVYAQACATGSWEGCEPCQIQLADWLEKWTPGIERDGRLVGVFPTPSGKGTSVEHARLAHDIRLELGKYE
jgi:hypothetical protein